MRLMIFNELGGLEYEYSDKDYKLIQSTFADCMYLKYISGQRYRVTKKYNYCGYYKVIIKDIGNGWTFVFDGINSDNLRAI